MLKTVLSISGKPGLYQLVSSAKNMVIVESLLDNRKMPIHSRDKVVSLGDISIYTEEDEVPLRTVLVNIKAKENGAKASVETNAKADDLRKYFEQVLPNYDKERVYPSDMKKMISWYNLLVNANIDFEQEDVQQQEEVAEEAQ